MLFKRKSKKNKVTEETKSTDMQSDSANAANDSDALEAMNGDGRDELQFPPGTPEASVKRQAQINLNAGAKSSEYSGSVETGWVLITIWF